MKNKDQIIKEHYATIGSKGGKSKSPKKQAASRANGAKVRQVGAMNHVVDCVKEGCKVSTGHKHIEYGK
jgi:hypothetical protein